MKKFALMLIPLSFVSMQSHAHDYPTMETVRAVVECMADLGEQNEQNLYTCTCRHDVIEKLVVFEEFERARFFERYNQMPGKRGGLVRDSKEGEKLVENLNAAREEAARECPEVKNIATPPKRDEE